MISESVIWWSLSAVVVFWSVGAYRRLVRLRSHAVRSFAVLVVPMQRYADTVPSCPVNPSDPAHPTPDATAPAWAELLQAQAQFSAALAVAQPLPLDAAAIHALVAADTILQLAWMRACADGCAGSDTAWPESLHTQWSEVRQQVSPAANAFAQAVTSYDTAITQFPALLLAWLLGFRTATLFPTDP